MKKYKIEYKIEYKIHGEGVFKGENIERAIGRFTDFINADFINADSINVDYYRLDIDNVEEVVETEEVEE